MRPPQSDVVRFTGLLGDALIQVTGAPVTVYQSETEVIIRSGDITVRIKKTEHLFSSETAFLRVYGRRPRATLARQDEITVCEADVGPARTTRNRGTEVRRCDS